MRNLSVISPNRPAARLPPAFRLPNFEASTVSPGFMKGDLFSAFCGLFLGFFVPYLRETVCFARKLGRFRCPGSLQTAAPSSLFVGSPTKDAPHPPRLDNLARWSALFRNFFYFFYFEC